MGFSVSNSNQGLQSLAKGQFCKTLQAMIPCGPLTTHNTTQTCDTFSHGEISQMTKTEHNLIFEFHAWPFLVGFCCVQWCSGVILVYSFGRLFIGIRSRKAPSLNEQVTESPLISPIKAPSITEERHCPNQFMQDISSIPAPYHIQHGNSINNMVKSFGFTWYRSAGTSVSYSLRSPNKTNSKHISEMY